MLLVVDFGSQTAHLIARRLKSLGAPAKIITPEQVLAEIQKEKPQGIVLSGGPSSVYEKGAPTIDKKIFSLGIPILGICYGFQLAAHLLGGKVIAGRKEYGPAKFRIKNQESRIMKGVKKESTVWMSHGDEIIAIPKSFTLIGSTPHVPNTAAEDAKKHIYMLQFHPEVDHTEQGTKILKNFIAISGVKLQRHTLDPKAMIEKIKNIVGNEHVIAAVSGGVDSTVAGVLVAKAIGKKFIPIFVDNGLMREGAEQILSEVFTPYGVMPRIIHVEKEMLKKLQGITDSEEKRKIIGKMYIDVFEKEMHKLMKKPSTSSGSNFSLSKRSASEGSVFLMQGTIFSDVIESKGSKHADKIKSHHNVGGLPKEMKLTLLEPLRELYKDEVRQLGKLLGLSKEVVWKQVFPGPGYAVRIRGEVTEERLAQEKQADMIVLEELKKAKVLDNVYMSFPIMTGATSTAVKGDGRFMGEVVALRVIESKNVMTTTWSRLSYDLLQKISSRIVNEVPKISRVVYDITTKPPATMEWE